MYVPVFERLRSNNISRSVTVSMVCLEAVRLRVSIECINRAACLRVSIEYINQAVCLRIPLEYQSSVFTFSRLRHRPTRRPTRRTTRRPTRPEHTDTSSRREDDGGNKIDQAYQE